jgi:hypothetical protein
VDRVLVGGVLLRQSRLVLGPTQPPVQWVPSYFPRRKAARGWRWPRPPPQSSAEAEEIIELYLYWPCKPSWPVPGWCASLAFWCIGWSESSLMYFSLQINNRLTDFRSTQYTYYADYLFLVCHKHVNVYFIDNKMTDVLHNWTKIISGYVEYRNKKHS